ncbi:Histone-lysine N-methyltransferase eggless [Halotydeus destructor]|nr:Histone-lysine N-methyltransferase eggless [Halotydeus destructor]
MEGDQINGTLGYKTVTNEEMRASLLQNGQLAKLFNECCDQNGANNFGKVFKMTLKDQPLVEYKGKAKEQCDRFIQSLKDAHQSILRADEDISRVEEARNAQERPTAGPLDYPKLEVSLKVYVPLKVGQLGCPWSEGEVKSIDVKINVALESSTKCRSYHPHVVVPKIVQNNLIAVKQLVVGRYYEDSEDKANFQLLSGLVAEEPSSKNRFRYLVFFDNMKPGYCERDEIYFHHRAHFDHTNVISTFIKHQKKEYAKFLKVFFRNYPEAMLLRPKPMDVVMLRKDEEWVMAKVYRTDCSLMETRVKGAKKKVWLFRGAYNLKPIWDKMALGGDQKVQSTSKVTSTGKRVTAAKGLAGGQKDDAIFYETQVAEETEAQETAQLSSSWSLPSPISFEVYNGAPVYVTVARELDKVYVPHDCCPSCLGDESDLSYHGQFYFALPLKAGWSRKLLDKARHRRKSKECIPKIVVYSAPCGKPLADMTEVKLFLKQANSKLQIDMFTFDPLFDIYPDKLTESCYYFLEDFSHGLENQPISVMNIYDDKGPELPEDFQYLQMCRIDDSLKEFKSCCDCTDNCANSETCSCQQATKKSFEAVNWENHGSVIKCYTGYIDRRHDTIMTAIFECNDGCSCLRSADQCPNRLISLGIKMRLQVFKYPNKGWGVRALHDIPAGTFVCLYSGDILSAEEGNDVNRDDTYFADMNTIESVETGKAAYGASVESLTSIDHNDNTAHSSGHIPSPLTLKEDLKSPCGALITSKRTAQ